MSEPTTACPDRNELQDFGLGRLDDDSLATISGHVETCDDCRRIVADLAADSFVGRLREAHDQRPPAGESIAVGRGETPSIVAEQQGDRDARQADIPPALVDHPDYEVLKELGRGGMGVVYLARNRPMDRLEVLKVVSKKLLDVPGALERFQQEIRSAARLSHPNIVGAHAVLRPGDLLVFAMEYVDGSDLAQLVRRRGPLPITNAAFYVHQAALGLQHAHERGMVHRDIKPNNLMLAISGKKHLVKILDFGLAKATSEEQLEASLTKSGQILGTPDYVAPEQTIDAHNADVRADIYSLGCTLYFLLTGKPPFTGKSLYEILRSHHTVQAKPVDAVRPEVPAGLAAVVARMMAKAPEERYQTPAEVAKALDPFFRADKGTPDVGANVATALPTAVAPPVDQSLNLSQILPTAAPVSPADYGESMAFSIAAASVPGVTKLRTLKKRGSAPPRRTAWMLIAAAAGAAAAFLSIWLIVRDKHGRETARVQVPDGGRVVIQPAAEPTEETASPPPVASSIEAIIASPLPVSTAPKTSTVSPPVTSLPTPAPTPSQTASQPRIPSVVATAGGSDRPSPPSNAKTFRGKQYLVYSESLPWHEAEAKCRSLGGELVQIKSAEEQEWLLSLVEASGVKGVWIGATDEGKEGVWRWVDDTPLAFTNWDSGERQPNNYGGVEDFAVLIPSVSGKWWDYPNDPRQYPAFTRLTNGSLGFICQWDSSVTPRIEGPFASTSQMPATDSPATKYGSSTDGFESIFNGRDLNGWSPSTDSSSTWQVSDGAITCDGREAAYLFHKDRTLEDFHLRAEVKIVRGDGGIYFRCRDVRGTSDFTGYEAQLANGVPGEINSQLTGGLYRYAKFSEALIPPSTWFSLEVIALGNRIRILVDGKQTTDFIDPQAKWRKGPIVLQHNGDDGKLFFRKLELKNLAAGAGVTFPSTTSTPPGTKGSSTGVGGNLSAPRTTTDAAGATSPVVPMQLQAVLIAYRWHYYDNLFPPGDECTFRDDGTFHRWGWNYWIVGPRSIRVHYDKLNKNRDTGVLYTFNNDLTEFRGTFKDGNGKTHIIVGTRRSKLLAADLAVAASELPRRDEDLSVTSLDRYFDSWPREFARFRLRAVAGLIYGGEVFGRRDVLCTHPISDSTPARLNFQRITRASRGTLVLYAASDPLFPNEPGGRVVAVVDGKTTREATVEKNGRWTTLRIPFDRQPVVVEHHAISWAHEGMFFDYELE